MNQLVTDNLAHKSYCFILFEIKYRFILFGFIFYFIMIKLVAKKNLIKYTLQLANFEQVTYQLIMQ